MNLVVTSGVLIACVVLNLILVGYITRLRLSEKVAFGHGESHKLNVAIRAHANLLENAAFVILLFLVAELQGVSRWLLAVLGLVFVIARLAHAQGLIRSSGQTHPGRYYGTLFSWLTMAALALILLWRMLTAQ
ncbi:MAPEG family protein [Proteobacteria bacterium 005FR1]|nr:MAPEG family protein [Proteobacteria bacterium 005FR1]